MIQFDFIPKEQPIIKVIGVGGGGGNAVTYMHSLGIDGVDFILANTDAKALRNSNVPIKVQLGPSLTQGLGAGANPEIGEKACIESADQIKDLLSENTKMVFITAGMGGGTGTGAAPVIASIAKGMGLLTVGIVTTPFSHEGNRRRKQAEAGISKMRDNVDTILIISNDKMRHAFGNLPFTQAFAKADNVLATAAKCITDVISSSGTVGLDFADVCTVMRDGGVAIMGSAASSGPDRAREAVQLAIDSPLLNDNQIKGAKWVLVNINSAPGEFEQTVDEIDAIQAYIQQEAGEECDVILGLGLDSELGEAISVTIIATGFDIKETRSAYDYQEKAAPSEEKIVVNLDTVSNPATPVNNEISSNSTAQAAEQVSTVNHTQPQTAPQINESLKPESKIIETPKMFIPGTLGMGFVPKARQQASTTESSQVILQDQVSIKETTLPIVNQEITLTPENTEHPSNPESEKIVHSLMPESTVEPKATENVDAASGIQSRIVPEDELVTINGITLSRRRGNYILSDSELRQEAEFELHKQAMYERANNLRRLSINNGIGLDSYDNDTPAYQQMNSPLPEQDNAISQLSIGDRGLDKRPDFLNSNKPD